MPLAQLYAATRQARKVLVVDLGFLGDTVHLVPALWDLKAAYPAAKLHVVTSPVGAAVCRLVPCVDRLWELELYRETRTLRQQWQVVRGLRREQFDVAFNFGGADRSVFLTGLSGARRRIAYPGGRRHFWNHWLVPHWAPAQDRNRPAYLQRKQTLSDCGVPVGPARFDLHLGSDMHAWAASLVPANAIHVSVNASKPLKDWPLPNCIATLRRVWADYPGMSVLASASSRRREQERLRALAAELKDDRLRLLPADLSIAQLSAVLTRCRLHFGPDSGVLHLACAVDVPTISLFRDQGGDRMFVPVGPKHQVIMVPCHCVDGRDAPCERAGTAECLARIEPERVAAVVRERLGAQN